MTKTQGPRFDVLRDGEPVAKNVGLTKAKELIKQGKEAFASSTWTRNAVGDTGIPDFLRIPQEQRNATWEKNPPKSMPAFERPARDGSDADKAVREKFLAEQAEAKKIKTSARISKMKARAEEGKPGPGMRWDTRTSRFVPEHVLATKSNPVEEVAMAKKAKAKKATSKPRGSNKTGIVADLLKRKDGCTSAEVLKATSWPAVSMPAMAKAAGLKLRKEKVKGEPTRYFGS